MWGLLMTNVKCSSLLIRKSLNANSQASLTILQREWILEIPDRRLRIKKIACAKRRRLKHKFMKI